MDMREMIDRLEAIENKTDEQFQQRLQNKKKIEQIEKWKQEIENEECHDPVERDKMSQILNLFNTDTESARHLLDTEYEKARRFLIRAEETRRLRQ